MQRFTTVLKTTTMDNEQSIPSRANIFVKNNSIKSSNENSFSPLNSDSSDNNETVTLTNSIVNNNSNNNNPPSRFRPTGRRFFSKSAAASRSVSRSASNASRILNAEKIYIQNSSEDQLSTSETVDLNSDEEDDEDKLVYKTCLESPPMSKSIYIKKSMSKPECAIKSYSQYSSSAEKSSDSGRRFVPNNGNQLRTSKSMSHCKGSGTVLENDDDEEENEDEEEEDEEEDEKGDELKQSSSLYYRQLDGDMKRGKLSRFKVIKSKSNSALQTRNSLNRKYDYNQQDDVRQHSIKGNLKDDQITSQVQLNELAERLKFIEQKLLENEMNTDKRLKNITQNISTSSYQPSNYQSSSFKSPPNYHQPNHQQKFPQANHLEKLSNHQPQFNHQNYQPKISNGQQQQQPNTNYQTMKAIQKPNQDDLCLKNGQFKARIYPSISFGDCSEINATMQPKKSKRHFFSSVKSTVKNSKSIPSYLTTSKVSTPNQGKYESFKSPISITGSSFQSDSQLTQQTKANRPMDNEKLYPTAPDFEEVMNNPNRLPPVIRNAPENKSNESQPIFYIQPHPRPPNFPPGNSYAPPPYQKTNPTSNQPMPYTPLTAKSPYQPSNLRPGPPMNNPGYSMNNPGYPMAGAYYPQSTSVLVDANAFDEGARFNQGASVTIPPCPPGAIPTPHQIAHAQGHRMVLGQKKASLFYQEGAGSVFW